jgi:hypothetical protein
MTDVDDRHQALIEPAANVVPEAPIGRSAAFRSAFIRSMVGERRDRILGVIFAALAVAILLTTPRDDDQLIPWLVVYVAVGTPIWLLKEFRRSRHSGASTEIALVSAMAAALAGPIGFASFVVLATVLPHPAPVDPFEHVPMPLVGLAIIVAAWVAVARLLRDI